jgi:hypothetical protein
MLEVLNLGAGVQSSTVLLMSIRGELPKLDHAIFADTGWEPQAVYRQMDWLEQQATQAGIKVWRVSVGRNIKSDALRSQVRGKVADGSRWASLPYFVLGPEGERGQIRRQCTYEYKIRPIERCLRRDILGLQPRQRAPKEVVVRRWFGISWDERRRMRESDAAFAVNWYPLVERHIVRRMCLDWLEQNGYPPAPRSACIGCPYRRNNEWLHLKRTSPEEFDEACQFDEAIRNCGGKRGDVFIHDVFIHDARIPLREVDLEATKYAPGQMMLAGMEDECAGICGV